MSSDIATDEVVPGSPISSPAIRHQQLIVTLYRLFSCGPGSVLPVTILIDLLEYLGYDEQRLAYRLKAKGMPRSHSCWGIAVYELSESVQEVFVEGDRGTCFRNVVTTVPTTDFWPFLHT